jgi:hypothetical protein
VERDYMYRRNSGGGHTPKMGHFVLGRQESLPEEEEGEGVAGAGAGGEGGRRRLIRERSDSDASSGSNSNPFEDLGE